jgi:hypothetical protein
VVDPGISIVRAGTRQIYGWPGYLPVCERHALKPVNGDGVKKNGWRSLHLMLLPRNRGLTLNVGGDEPCSLAAMARP